jgi:hypothetical protein
LCFSDILLLMWIRGFTSPFVGKGVHPVWLRNMFPKLNPWNPYLMTPKLPKCGKSPWALESVVSCAIWGWGVPCWISWFNFLWLVPIVG